MVNAGRLPLGVTPQTISHDGRHRNDGLARVFHDLGLMEREGTSLARIEPHRLRALVREDLRRYPASAIGEVHRRVGAELARAQLKRVLAELVRRGELQMTGAKRGARYSLTGGG